jgi:hypothetical protein
MEAAEDKLAAHAPWLDMDYDDSVDGVDGRSIGCWFPTGSSSPSSMSSEVIRGGGDLLASFSDELSSSDAGGNATWPAPPFMGTTGAVQNLHHVEEEAAEYGLGASSSLHPECTTELHSAWALLARDDALAWRRAACREPDALTDTERAKGGLLKLLQSDEAPQQLTVPAGTRGALSAYMHSTAELSAAVRSYLATTPDLFCPLQFPTTLPFAAPLQRLSGIASCVPLPVLSKAYGLTSGHILFVQRRYAVSDVDPQLRGERRLATTLVAR